MTLLKTQSKAEAQTNSRRSLWTGQTYRRTRDQTCLTCTETSVCLLHSGAYQSMTILSTISPASSGSGPISLLFLPVSPSSNSSCPRFSLSEIKIYRRSWINRIIKIYRKYRTKLKKNQIVLKNFRRI